MGQHFPLSATGKRPAPARAWPRKRAQPEAAIQKAICDYIAVVAPAVICYAVPNASQRTPGGRASNAVPGLRKGVWDLALILPAFPQGRPAAIEVKTPVEIEKANRGLSPEQQQYELDLIRMGVPHCVACSINDVRAAFAHWGVTTREAVA